MLTCPIHGTPLTQSFDPNNSFCFQCEVGKQSKSFSATSEGFYVPPAPVGENKRLYYAVLQQPWPAQDAQFTYLFKTRTQVKEEVARRAAANLNATFTGVKVETLTECAHWFGNGMSKDMYAIWTPSNVPKRLNGNHAVSISRVTGGTSKSPNQVLSGKTAKKPISKPTPKSKTTPSATVPKPAAQPKVAPKKTVKPSLAKKLKKGARGGPLKKRKGPLSIKGKKALRKS